MVCRYQEPELEIPGCKQCIHPGDIIKLGRFETTTWVVGFGWYSWGGNRPFCGWFLVNSQDKDNIKPLQKPDLDDIYFITQ